MYTQAYKNGHCFVIINTQSNIFLIQSFIYQGAILIPPCSRCKGDFFLKKFTKNMADDNRINEQALNEAMDVATTAARCLAQAKVCRDTLNRRASGRDNPEVGLMQERLKRCKDILYIWMYNRGSICSNANFKPDYPQNAGACDYYAGFTWKVKFPAQPAIWLQEQTLKLFQSEQVFSQAFEYHLSNTFGFHRRIDKASFFQRLIFDTLYSASATIKTTFDISTRDPNSTRIIKRLHDGPDDSIEQQGNSQYVCGLNGERLRVERIHATATSQKQQDAMAKSRTREMIGYYLADEFNKTTKKKPSAIQVAEFEFVYHCVQNNQQQQTVLDFNTIKAQVQCVPPPGLSVTPRVIVAASETIYKEDKRADLQREIHQECTLVEQLDDAILDYGAGTLRSQIAHIDRIEPIPDNPNHWASWFVAKLNEYISTQEELKAVQKQIKSQVKREQVSPENLSKVIDPNDMFNYWTQHCDNKQKLGEYENLVEQAFENEMFAHDVTEGDQGELILPMGCLSELNTTVQVKLEYAKPTNRPAIMPKTALKWESVWRAINNAIITVGNVIQRPLKNEMMHLFEQASKDQVGADMQGVWREMANADLFGQIMQQISDELIRIDPPKTALKIVPVTKESEKDMIIAM